MGKKPYEIEREIRDKREIISRRIETMTNRTAEDAREISSRLKKLTSTTTLRQGIDEHPISFLGGALALGVALGMASEGVSFGGEGSAEGRSRYRTEAQRDRSEAKPGLLGSLLQDLELAAVEEGRQLIREWVAASRDDRKTNGR